MDKPLVITDKAQLEAAVGQLVTLRGTVRNTQMPTLLGVDIESDVPDLRGQPATATGILKRQVITQADIDKETKENGQYAHRGPGTFYHLEDAAGHAVQVQKP